MNKIASLLTLAASIIFSSSALARWDVQVDEDLFSSTGKKAVMMSGHRSDLLLFSCDADKLEMALLSPSRKTFEEKAFDDIPVKLIIKVDDSKPLHFDANINRRNEHYHQVVVKFSHEDPANYIVLLEKVKNAMDKILVGISADNSGHRQTISITINGSTVATSRFMASCGL